MALKNGTRLQSQVCDTQVIIVRASTELDDLRCGGAAMLPLGSTSEIDVELDTELAGGNVMGKRYVTTGGAEILVTKAGRGTLSIGSTPLDPKEAKALPASD